MKASKPIKVFWTKEILDHAKILIILEELRLPYESNFVKRGDLLKFPWDDEDTDENVPGHMAPVIIDPNNVEFKLSESSAIVSYLISTYDESHALTYTRSRDDFRSKQWSSFQATDQNPYFALAAGFVFSQHEPIPDVGNHFLLNVNRVITTINCHLADRTWLVGDKCTYVDLSFVIWNTQIPLFEKQMPRDWTKDRLSDLNRWQEAMMQRESVKKVLNLMGIKNAKSDGKS